MISGPFGALRRFNADGSADTGFGDNGILSLPGVFTARDTEIDSQDRIVVLDDDFIIRIDSNGCLLYTSPSPRDLSTSRMPSSA